MLLHILGNVLLTYLFSNVLCMCLRTPKCQQLWELYSYDHCLYRNQESVRTVSRALTSKGMHDILLQVILLYIIFIITSQLLLFVTTYRAHLLQLIADILTIMRGQPPHLTLTTSVDGVTRHRLETPQNAATPFLDTHALRHRWVLKTKTEISTSKILL